MKRIVTIQDISCVGKCSLTVALPIISALGIETAVIPTAVLSTHTAFQNFTFQDLSDQILPIANHWKNEKINFDAIYTGYLGSINQIQIISQFYDMFKTNQNILFVDPAMADNGKLYPTFNQEFVKQMAWLCSRADIIVPNITEAAFMTGQPYYQQYDSHYIRNLLYGLAKLGAKKIILTGVSYHTGEIGVAGFDTVSGKDFLYNTNKIGTMYHGTGDIFASVCLGCFMHDMTLQQSASIAADYVAETILTTLKDPNKRFYGVNFEQTLPTLLYKIRNAT